MAIKFLDTIFNSTITKSVFVYLLITFLLYFFRPIINSFIYEYLTIETGSINGISLWIILIFIFFCGIFLVYKFYLKAYQPSTIFLHTVLTISLLFFIVRFTTYADKWELISVGNSWFCYIDIIGFICFLSTLLLLVQFVKKYSSNRAKIPLSPFIADDPIEFLEDDKLNYSKRADDLIDYLARSSFVNSFTIGIVGPWGNGKSSLIRLIEKKIEERDLKNTIQLKFLPYLNHNESDIISEFFKRLSEELKNHSGKLSNHVLDYSDKLLKLYKNKNIKDFFSKNTSASNISSLETYNEINSILKELNKKFIVFIDDLDRLSSNEVLQVLKLVRNTANFKNFIFIIALDKDYILNILMKNNDIADHAFVDKFFQLEVYLPEIEKKQLKQDFVELLKKSDLKSKILFIKEAEEAIYNKYNLFDDYISNHRAVKRLINQLVFDYHSLPDKLDTNDLLNFTYLKMKFPSMIKFLYHNRETIIPYNPDTKLCELTKVDKENSQKDAYKMIETFYLYKANTFTPKYEDYIISASLTEQQELDDFNQLSVEQNLLIAKTLIVLFGDVNKSRGGLLEEHTTEEHTSIKFGNNLRILLQQKVTDNDLTYDEFIELLKTENDFEKLKHALQKKQTQDIIDKISFFNTRELNQIQSVIITLLFIHNEYQKYGTNSFSVLDTLTKFIKRNTSNNNDVSKSIWTFINKNYIKGNFNITNKLIFLSFLSQYRIKMSIDSWGTSEDELKKISLKLYREYIESMMNKSWSVNDYSFYHAYHNVRKFQLEKTVNPILMKLLNNNDIHLFCAQLTEAEMRSSKIFKTADFVLKVFGTKQSYFEFINNKASEIKSKDLDEYLKFLTIESYTGFSKHVRFEFKDFELMMEKLKSSDKNENDEYDNIVEIFVRSISSDFFQATQRNLNREFLPGYLSFYYYNIENIYYSSYSIDTKDIHKTKDSILSHFMQFLDDKESYKISDDRKAILNDKNIKVIEIVSIQPEY